MGAVHIQKIFPGSSTMSGAQAARYVLDHNGLSNVRIVRIAGNLTDNYNPVTKVLSLSDSTYDNYSAAAVGVACHEAGHAIQDARHYLPNRIRSALVPIVNIGSSAAIPLFILGLLLDVTGLMWAGIILFSFPCFLVWSPCRSNLTPVRER